MSERHIYGGAHRAANEGPNRQPGPTAAQIAEAAGAVKALVERSIADPASPERTFMEAALRVIGSQKNVAAELRSACLGLMREQQALGTRGELAPGSW